MSNKVLMIACLALVNSALAGKTIAQIKTEADSLYAWVKASYDGEEELIANCLAWIKSTGQWTDVADIKTQAASLYTWVLAEIN